MLFNLDAASKDQIDNFRQTVNAEANPVRYLGIDPGGSNGITGYDEKYYVVFTNTVKAADMVKFLHLFDHIITCVCESYFLFPNKTQQQIYSDMETPRVIGRIEGWAATKDVNLVMQGASVKDTAYKWLGEKKPPKSDPLNHQKDSHAHFMFWAIRTGKINAADLLRKSRKATN